MKLLRLTIFIALCLLPFVLFGVGMVPSCSTDSECIDQCLSMCYGEIECDSCFNVMDSINE